MQTKPAPGLSVCALALTFVIAGCNAAPKHTAIDIKSPKPADSAKSSHDQLRVMSFNLRTSTIFDLHNTWGFRKDLVVNTIQRFNPHVLGTQECRPQQARYLRDQLPGYGFVGAGRDDGDDEGEMVAIFYRDASFTELDHGHFWLSTTPGAAGSESWDTFFPRMVSWVKLQRKRTNQTMYVFNTHFSAFGDDARRASARLLREQISRVVDRAPVIVTGDFNARIESKPYTTLVDSSEADQGFLTDSFTQVHPTVEQGPGTIHGFDGRADGRRIDWILTTPGFKPVSAAINRTHRDGRYPSDHFPVTAVLRWPGHVNDTDVATEDDAENAASPS